MKECIIVIIISLLLPLSNTAQVAVSKLDNKTHLDQLKDGILLVQLPNRDNKIAKLKKMGASKKAKEEADEIQAIREGILEGFKEKFNYCGSYFFERKHTREVLAGNYENVLDANLKPIQDFPETKNIYVAQYGTASPKGEVYRYNGVGFQIKHILNGQLETLDGDYFYKRSKVGILMGRKKAVIVGIQKLNSKLKKMAFVEIEE